MRLSKRAGDKLEQMEREEKYGPSETVIELSVTEYETSVLRGALQEFAVNWSDETQTATELDMQVANQLPPEWE